MIVAHETGLKSSIGITLLLKQHFSDSRKIDPSRGTHLPDGTPNDNDRVEIGPTQLAFGEWEAAGLVLPNLAKMREYRWKRLT